MAVSKRGACANLGLYPKSSSRVHDSKEGRVVRIVKGAHFSRLNRLSSSHLFLFSAVVATFSPIARGWLKTACSCRCFLGKRFDDACCYLLDIVASGHALHDLSHSRYACSGVDFNETPREIRNMRREAGYEVR